MATTQSCVHTPQENISHNTLVLAEILRNSITFRRRFNHHCSAVCDLRHHIKALSVTAVTKNECRVTRFVGVCTFLKGALANRSCPNTFLHIGYYQTGSESSCIRSTRGIMTSLVLRDADNHEVISRDKSVARSSYTQKEIVSLCRLIIRATSDALNVEWNIFAAFYLETLSLLYFLMDEMTFPGDKRLSSSRSSVCACALTL